MVSVHRRVRRETILVSRSLSRTSRNQRCFIKAYHDNFGIRAGINPAAISFLISHFDIYTPLLPNPDKPEIGNIKIENLKVKLRRLYNAMMSQKNRPASHFTFSFLISHFDI
jgi:hypothetical protein